MFKPLKQLHFYYASVISIVLLSLVLGTYYLYRANLEDVLLDIESLANLENLDEQFPLDDVLRSVWKDRPKESLKILSKLDGNSLEIHRVLPSESYDEFKREGQRAKESLHQLIARPELSSIFPVLVEKVIQFKTYVTENNWKTLGRISRRTARGIQSWAMGDMDISERKKLRGIYSMTGRNLKAMEQVTKSSRLSDEEKKRILSMLSGWKIELDMIEHHLGALVSFEEVFEYLKRSYINWQGDLMPKAMAKKINIEKNSRNALLAMVLFSLFLLLSLIVGKILSRRIEKKMKKNHEEDTLNIINAYLIPIQGRMRQGISQEFQIEMEKLKKYLQKRMSYGIVFQEATPFATLLLDENLNLIWANDLFYKTWNWRRKNSEDPIPWDHIQQFTNLGENDPIVESLKNNVAGIYNIQVKAEGTTVSLPFEMYVSPVLCLGQRRMMIFLYPLRPMEETLGDQAKALIGPVARSLDALIGKGYTDNFSHRIQKDFEIAGIEHIHKKFISYNQLVLDEKNDLMEEMKKMENEMSDIHKLMNDMKDILNTIEMGNEKRPYLFSSVKSAFIDSAEFHISASNSYKKSFENSKVLLSHLDKLLVRSLKMNDIFKESAVAMDTVLQSRNKLKEILSAIDDFKYSLSQKFEKSIIQYKMNYPSQEKILKDIKETKGEVKKLDEALSLFSKVATHLDASLSKVKMILKEENNSHFPYTDKFFVENRHCINTEMATINRLNEKIERNDQLVIDKIHDLYKNFEAASSDILAMRKLVETYRVNSGKHPLPPSLTSSFTVSEAVPTAPPRQ